MVKKCECLADIGTDHGKLPAMALRRGIAERVICCDISADSLQKARTLLENDRRAEFRIADGLAGLLPGESDCIVIAGMGGHTIAEILAARPKGVPGKTPMLFSAHSALPELRRFLMENHFAIVEESIAREDRRYYPIMRVMQGEMALSPEQILMGRFLPFVDDPLRKEYLLHLYRRIKKEAEASNDPKKREYVRWIEEVL